MLFAEDIGLCGKNYDEAERITENYRKALKDIGLNISRKNTKDRKFCGERNNIKVRFQGEILKRGNKFKYLKSTVTENGELDVEIFHRMQSRWRK